MGPSGSGVQPTLDSDSDMDDDHLLQEQIRQDLSQTMQDEDEGPEEDDCPESAEGFWKATQPGVVPRDAAFQFNTLTRVQKDNRVCIGMNLLVDEITQFAAHSVGREEEKSFMKGLLANEDNKVLIRYLGCIAQGGPKGADGWRTLLANETCRQALLIGVIGRILEEKVFSELFFGGDSSSTERLKKMEEQQVDGEGRQ